MKKRDYRIFLVGIAVLGMLYGCGTSENYKMGQDLVGQNRWDEAIGYFETALKEDPSNASYKSSLLQAKQQAAKIHLEKAKQAQSNAPARNLRALEAIVKGGDLAASLDPVNSEIKNFNNQLRTKIAALRTEVKALYDKADADILKEDWLAAVTKLRQVNQIYTGYEDAGSKLARAEQEGAKVLYQQGIELGKQEDWKMAAQSLKTAMDINPKYMDVARQYEVAKSRDNVDYAISESINAEKAQKWERAILLAEKAADYQPDNRELLARLDQLKVKVGQGFFDDAVNRPIRDDCMRP
jgi:tetratricopeptide (TPR) repeat protein